MKSLDIFKYTAPALIAAGCAFNASADNGRSWTNFVLINFDDAGNGDFSYSGALGYTTPNIDRIAAEGVRFTNFYAVQPVSGASRAGLLTGCYPNRIGFAHAPGPGWDKGINPQEETIAEVLKKKNYATAIFGKWHLGDALPFLPLQHGFDEYYGLPYSNDMWPSHPTIDFPDLPTIEGNEVVGYNLDQSRLTTDYTDCSIDFIRRNSDRPFFLYLAHNMPHVPLAVSDKFKGKSEQGLYGDVMMELDWSVGEIMKLLRELGLDENTLVVITSDNGPWANYGNHAGSSGGLREAKGTTYNGGVRVPCIAYMKGFTEAGGACNRLLSNIDILPTFARLAGAELPRHTIDGVSFVTLLENPVGPAVRESLCLYYQDNSLEAVTDGTYKLIFPHRYTSFEVYEPGMDGRPGRLAFVDMHEPELYDLRRDPGERQNLIGMYPEIAARLMEIAQNCREDIGDDLTGHKGANRRPLGTIED